MKHPLASTILMSVVASAATAQADSQPTDPAAARARIAEIIAKPEPTAEDVTALSKLASEIDDPALAANALVNAGTMAHSLADPAATDLLRNADRLAPDDATRTTARFNLGHALAGDFPEPQSLQDPAEIQSVIARLEQSAAAFRSVLEITPDHPTAAQNTERVRRRVRDLHQRIEELRRQEQARKELAEQMKKLAEQQQAESEQSQSQADAGKSPDGQAQQDQQRLSEQTEESQQRSQQSGASEAAQESLRQAQEAQRNAAEALERGDAQSAAESQRQAAEALREAAEQLESQQQPSESQGQQPQPSDNPSDQPQQGQQQAEEPAESGDPLANALIDKERRERAERMRYLQRSGRQRVERDW